MPNRILSSQKKLQVNSQTFNIRKVFFLETFAKNKNNRFLAETLQTAMDIEQWINTSTFIRTEKGKHHSFNFRVYQATYKGHNIEFKVKDNGSDNIYTMRFI